MRFISSMSLVLAIAFSSAPTKAQDLGHRLIGTMGLNAGKQLAPGLYVADQLVYYEADTLHDRSGSPLPIEAFRLEALANALGVVFVFYVPEIATFVSATAAVPLARLSVNSDHPLTSIDRFGLGDVFLQPLRIGWRIEHLDVIASYSLYVPTGLFQLGRGGVSSGQYTQEWSLGVALYADTERRYYATAVASYDFYHQKQGIDITRGDVIHIQGGIGANLFGLVDIGVVGAALWQVRDDRGSELPPALQGARDRAYAIGGELGIMLPTIRGRITARYEHELDTRARPEGQILVFQLAVAAWQPEAEPLTQTEAE
jgi:hypothetical protein